VNLIQLLFYLSAGGALAMLVGTAAGSFLIGAAVYAAALLLLLVVVDAVLDRIRGG
jgi:hypothetical protein